MKIRSLTRANLIRQIILYSLIFLFLLIVWNFIVSVGIWDETIVPSPIATFKALLQFHDEFLNDFIFTFGLICEGFILTILLALGIAVCLHFLPKLSKIIYNLSVMLQSVPLFAIAPVLFYFTGRDHIRLGQLITIILTAFFPVFVNTTEGLQRIDRDLSDVFDSMNATKCEKFVKLALPSALHMVLAGLKITLTMCVIGAVIAEMLVGEQRGLGFRVKDANAHMNMAEVFAALVLLAFTTILLFFVLRMIAYFIQPWAAQEDRNENQH